MSNCSYTFTGDRIWVHKGGEFIGWLDNATGKIVHPVSEAKAAEMLQDALKRKPKTS